MLYGTSAEALFTSQPLRTVKSVNAVLWPLVSVLISLMTTL